MAEMAAAPAMCSGQPVGIFPSGMKPQLMCGQLVLQSTPRWAEIHAGPPTVHQAVMAVE